MVDIANLVIQTLIGIATFAAVCISLWQVRYEKRLREEESKRQQAIRVSLWYEGERNRTDCPKDDRFVWKSVVLRNESESPVYDVIVTCVGISGAGPERKGENSKADFPCRVCIGTLPPGLWHAWLPTEGSGMHVRTAPEAAFTDASEVSWVRRGNGMLEQIQSRPAAFYGLELPLGWCGCKVFQRLE